MVLAGVLSERWGWGRWDGGGGLDWIGLDWGSRRGGCWGKVGSFSKPESYMSFLIYNCSDKMLDSSDIFFVDAAPVEVSEDLVPVSTAACSGTPCLG